MESSSIPLSLQSLYLTSRHNRRIQALPQVHIPSLGLWSLFPSLIALNRLVKRGEDSLSRSHGGSSSL